MPGLLCWDGEAWGKRREDVGKAPIFRRNRTNIEGLPSSIEDENRV